MVDLIRFGKAPEVIRRKGAEGNLPLPAEDKIEILTLLAKAPEADLHAKALETLRSMGSRGSHAPGYGQPADGSRRACVLRRSNCCHSGRNCGKRCFGTPASRPKLGICLQTKRLLPKPAVVEAHAVAANRPAHHPNRFSLPLRAAMPEIGESHARAGSSASVPGPCILPDEKKPAVEILARLAAGAKIEEVTGHARGGSARSHQARR